MTRTECVGLLEPLRLAMGVEVDQPTWTVYFRALHDLPVQLLLAAVDRALKSSTRFMPKPGELRQFAEDARTALMASVQYVPCAQCDETGWEGIEIDGVTRARRCGCWHRHQEKIQALGVGHEPLALPAGGYGDGAA